MQAGPMMAAAAKAEAQAAIQEVCTLAISYMAGMARREAVSIAVGASLANVQQRCLPASLEMAYGLSLMTIACIQLEEAHAHSMVRTHPHTYSADESASDMQRVPGSA